MSKHIKVLNFTRAMIALLLLVAIWVYPGALSSVCASLGTVTWLFMAQVVRFEERMLDKFGG